MMYAGGAARHEDHTQFTSESITKGTPAERKLGFRIHAITFVPTIVLLLVINLWTGSPYWVLSVLLAWGIGLFCHWFFVLGPVARKTGTS